MLEISTFNVEMDLFIHSMFNQYLLSCFQVHLEVMFSIVLVRNVFP